ncbi:enoyl-CoA hydratase [Chitinophaga costaii]|uniref:Enoyl-CoA hydratase n=1 Tax=Chitinophaga costaii TaxID=1335309 RepID=A0A1C4DR82_9BACT|nr:enoyl-CoA hydratase-related protein [Chitinophaga costaii]PUZ27749.1 enoyl-CoA hydratase [Chitinophaga costaii]SCC33843.1 enoyl-CoA hydratase [Chitinophaga costaii]
MYATLNTQLTEGTYLITINRPDKMNALNQQVLADLALAVDEVYSNAGIQSAIITGAGEKAFVAGADISEFLSLTPTQGADLAQKGQVIFQRIADSPKPIVAAVNGFALGGGCELAMACHFRVASEKAKFGQPEVNLGLIPGYGGTQRLTQLIGRGKAIELMLTADMLPAAEALSWGLVNHVVAPDTLLSFTQALLQKIHAKAPLAVGSVIQCVNAALDKNVDGFAFEINAFSECFATKDLQEGAQAFLEKRPAKFTGA